MKLLRYRRPSVNAILGITQAKRRIRRELGISQLEAFTKPGRVKQRFKYRLGDYTPIARVIRNTAKGRFPGFLALLTSKRK